MRALPCRYGWVLQCAEDGEECVIESAMFSIVDGNLFVSNVGAASASPNILRGKGWVATEEKEEQDSGRGTTTVKATLKPEVGWCCTEAVASSRPCA